MHARGEQGGTLRRVAGLFRPYRGRVAVVGSLILLTSLMGVVNPHATKPVFDKALYPPDGEKALTLLYELIGLMILVPVLAAAIGVVHTCMTTVDCAHV